MPSFGRIASIVALSALSACTAEADTPVSGGLFQAILPGQWSQVSAKPDLYVYRRAADDAQVTFSSLYSAHSMPVAQQRETLQLLTDKHRAAQLKAGPGIVLSVPVLSASRVSARFVGYDSGARLRAATLLLGGSNGVVITYFEVIDTDEKSFESQAENILASVSLK